MKRILGAFLLLGVGLIAQNATPPSAPENGKRLYVKNGCYECHGYAGQGGVGPRLAPRPMAAVALTAYIRKPAGQMPPYTAKVMSDAEIADVRAYLASLPEPPPVKNIELLNQ